MWGRYRFWVVWSPPSGHAPDKVKGGADSESPMSATHMYIVRMGLSVTVWAQIKSRSNRSIFRKIEWFDIDI